MSWARIINRAWYLHSLPAARRFEKALRYAGDLQRQRLLAFLQAQQHTAIGQQYDYNSIKTLTDFRQRIPIHTWTDVAPWVDRIMAGEKNVLTTDPVTRLVPTGGSSGGLKLIPWTSSFGQEFRNALAPWVVNIQDQFPAFSHGRHYWSISPHNSTHVANSQVPIGFDDDSAYLGGAWQRLLMHVLAVPAAMRHVHRIEDFQYATLYVLLARHDLSFISIWHPSFLQILLDKAQQWRDKLLFDFTHNDVQVSADFPRDLLRLLTTHSAPSKDRIDYLHHCDWRDVNALWPRLSLISCWGDGAAQQPLRQLQHRCGQIPIQAKGLLATEGVISFPFNQHHVLAVNSHLYEFMDMHGKVYWADELKVGEQYEILLTTSAGLVRYKLGDRIRVDDYIEQTPSIRFLGRGENVVDLCGEKMDEAFVADCLNKLPLSTTAFKMVAPECDADTYHYTLFTSNHETTGTAEQLDQLFMANPHYALARRLGQLAPLRVCHVSSDADVRYIDYQIGSTALAAIKPVALHADISWRKRLL